MKAVNFATKIQVKKKRSQQAFSSQMHISEISNSEITIEPWGPSDLMRGLMVRVAKYSN
jgi:hypothetical protein